MGSMTGLLILTQPVRKITSNLPQVLRAASEYVTGTLYVHLDSLAKTRSSEKPHLAACSRIITNIYSASPTHCKGLDVRVLLAGFKGLSEVPSKTSSRIDLVLFDQVLQGHELTDLEQRYKSYLSESRKNQIFLSEQIVNGDLNYVNDINSKSTDKVYGSVVIGGTFDCIHDGHKILLSQALLRCRDRLTVGVADGPLLKNKTLSELVEICDIRIDNVRNLAMDIDPSVDYNIVPILDPMGPTRWDPDMDMIVVSEETKKGIDFINKAREEAGLKVLDGHIISLLEDKCRVSEEEEVKISASSQRMRLLGTLLKPPATNSDIPKYPYVIGLTGGSASGKSSIARRLEKLGAGVIDCDRLGHEAYIKGTDCYFSLIEEFGNDILSNEEEIDRKSLGSKVFNNKDALEKLNGIVWPEIARLAKVKIDTLVNEGKDIILLDAAVLLEAGWEKICHQVWVCIIKREEAIRRIMERDGKSRNEAERRIDNQLSNKERVCHANVVFCTQWSGDYTQQQVVKAWEMLTSYIQTPNNQKAQL